MRKNYEIAMDQEISGANDDLYIAGEDCYGPGPICKYCKGFPFRKSEWRRVKWGGWRLFYDGQLHTCYHHEMIKKENLERKHEK